MNTANGAALYLPPGAREASGQGRSAYGMERLALAARLIGIALAYAGLAAIVYGALMYGDFRPAHVTVMDRAAIYEYASNRLCSRSTAECARLAHVIMANTR